MGSSDYSGYDSITSDTYASLKATRTATKGVASFSYTADVRAGKVSAKVSDRLDPSTIKDSVIGKRESRDGDIGNSNAIAVFFDETGSMGNIPRVLQEKLVKLMGSIQTKGVIDNPQILFGAVGDATCDRAPFQVGQFESDLSMDEDLDQFYLEGHGGGQNTESYELPLFFLARLTSIDCLEKRGKRGYAFIIGDETAYSKVKKREVEKVFGDSFGMQGDIPIKDIIKEAQEKYELFFIVPRSTSYPNRENMGFWKNLLGQNVLELDDPALVCELIVSTIGLAEGSISSVSDVADVLKMSKTDVDTVTRSLSVFTKSGRKDLATVSGGSLTPSSDVGLDL